MTENQQTFASSADAKKAGYFSRRHRTAAEHTAARARPSRFNPASKKIRQLMADQRRHTRSKLTDQQQLAKLDKLYPGGATRERIKLKKRIALAAVKSPETKAIFEKAKKQAQDVGLAEKNARAAKNVRQYRA